MKGFGLANFCSEKLGTALTAGSLALYRVLSVYLQKSWVDSSTVKAAKIPLANGDKMDANDENSLGIENKCKRE